jgi:SAM-dependent methyltransferase
MDNAAHWDDRYRTGNTPWDTGRPSAELARVLVAQKILPGRAIEFGSGSGTNALYLARQGFDVTAVDVSTLAISAAAERARQAGLSVRFIAADLLDPPDLGGPFDFFFDRGCYHVVRRLDVQKFVATLCRFTRPGSLGLVLTGNARRPREPGPPVVSEADIRTELGQAFDILRLEEFHFSQEDKDGVPFLGWSCLLRRPEAR